VSGEDILTGFRDPEHARALVSAIHELATVPQTFMEVCGTHTMAIAKNGLRGVMPENIKLLSGPGCPVCVTGNADIDMAIELARQPHVILTTFGDMMKVLKIWKTLYEAGIYTNAALPPAVTPELSLLRTSYMATHTDEQIDRVLQIFHQLKGSLIDQA